MSGYNSFVYSFLPYGSLRRSKKKTNKCGKRKRDEGAERVGWGGKGVGVGGTGKMRGKRKGETDILEKGQATQARFC